MSDSLDRSVPVTASASANDGRRFEDLCLPYEADLYRFVFWLCRDPALTQDVMQETLVRAWRSIGSLDDESAVRPWLFTIARRELARTFERKRLETVDLDSVLRSADGGPAAADSAEVEDMRAAILQLEDTYREPLVLQVLFGYSTAQIAEHLGISNAAVLTRLYRARHVLRKKMLGQGVGRDPDGGDDELS
jgi:RNA polymerase sigma-70 factor (ECF subfamily)